MKQYYYNANVNGHTQPHIAHETNATEWSGTDAACT